MPTSSAVNHAATGCHSGKASTENQLNAMVGTFARLGEEEKKASSLSLHDLRGGTSVPSGLYVSNAFPMVQIRMFPDGDIQTLETLP